MESRGKRAWLRKQRGIRFGNANVVSGKLALHAGVSETEVVSWAEVTIGRRLDPAARRLAREYALRREGLVPVDEDVEDGERDRLLSDRVVAPWSTVSSRSAPPPPRVRAVH